MNEARLQSQPSVNWLIKSPADKFILHVLQLLLIVASAYYFVLLPLIREFLYFTTEWDYADSVWLSLLFLQPLDVFHGELNPAPSEIGAWLLYYLKPVVELLCFGSGCTVAMVFEQKVDRGLRIFIYLSSAGLVGMLAMLVYQDCFGGIMGFVPALSGMGVVSILRSSPRRT